MSWIALTEDHVLARISKKEREVLDAAGQKDGFTSRLPGIIEQITGLVRGKIASCRNNSTFGPAGTIPDSCLYHAAALARNALITALPVAEGYTDPRQKETTDALKFLDDVASCAVVIETPSDSYPNSGRILYGSKRKLCF